MAGTLGNDPCGGTTQYGKACRREAIPTLGYCAFHIPEELIGEAEALGYVRCDQPVRDRDNPNFGQRCRNLAVTAGRCQYHQAPKHVPDDDRDKEPEVTKPAAIIPLRSVHAQKEPPVDLSAVQNPLQALLELTAEAHAYKEELRRRVVALNENEWRYENIAGEQIRGDIILYERALDRTARMLLMIAKLGIEERLARVSERQATLIEQVIIQALDESGADIAAQDRARALIARKLRSA
jgi:hypothetical protein